MKFLITGASGLIGTKLVEALILKGYDDIRILTRNKSRAITNFPFPVEIYEWEPNINQIESGALIGVDVVINLAGESIDNQRWNETQIAKIKESRINSTYLLMNEIKKLSKPPSKFLSASAIGIYGNREEDSLNENSSLGNGFLAELCQKWESIVINQTIDAMSCHILRIGIVLSNQGGALKKMLLPFKAGIAGTLGAGKQYMSWIHIEDLIEQIIFLIQNKGLYKVYNCVAPTPLSNRDFTKILGKVLKRPTILSIPKIILKIIFGGISEVLLSSQKVVPMRFLDEKYNYKYSNLNAALQDLLKHDLKNEKILQNYQWINKPLNEVFEFFSNETNLETITPKFLNFKVVAKSTVKIEEGTLIDYKLMLHGVPIKWKSEIVSFIKNESFIDTQKKGPYSKWVHYHGFIPLKKGTLIEDSVVYKIPFGVLGNIFLGYFIKNNLNNIFNYRKQMIQQILSN